MRVLLVHGCTVFDNLGGSEVQLNYIARFLRTRGHQVLFYTMDHTPEKPDAEECDGFTLYRNTLIKPGIFSSICHVRHILRIVQSVDVDLLFARSLRSVYVLHRVSRITGVPFVYQLPCMFDESLYSVRVAVRSIRKLHTSSFGALLAPWYFWKADRVLTVSRDDALRISTRFKIPVQAIYNMHPVPPVNTKISSDGVRIVWLHNIKPLKRPEMFIELARRCVDTTARFVMAGLLPNGAYGKRVCDAMGSTPNIEYRGRISLAESNDLLGTAALNIVTSHSEGFSNVSIQGWLFRVPVITTIDKDDVVARNGIGAAVTNVEELEGKVRFYLNNPDELASAGHRAREYALKMHNIDSNGPLYERLFGEVIESAQKGRAHD